MKAGLNIAAATVALVLTAGQTLGHSFDVAIVVVSEGPAMADVLAGFRTATRERDGHDNEESDGHLGGLDVYMLPVGAEADRGAVPGLAAGADIVLVLGDATLAEELRRRFETSGPPVIGAGMLSGGEEGWAEAESAASFLSRFEAEHDRQASHDAAQGYNAARRIELAVRPLGGVDDQRALADALSATRSGIDW